MAPNAPAPSQEAGLFQGIALAEAAVEGFEGSVVSHPVQRNRKKRRAAIDKKRFIK